MASDGNRSAAALEMTRWPGLAAEQELACL